MKIKFTQPKHSYTYTLPFTRVFKIEGILSGHPIPVHTNIEKALLTLRTPRRLYCKFEITYKIGPHNYYHQENEDIKIYWRHKRNYIPQINYGYELKHLLKIPEDQPAIRQLKETHHHITVESCTTLTNRVVIKTALQLNLIYTPRI